MAKKVNPIAHRLYVNTRQHKDNTIVKPRISLYSDIRLASNYSTRYIENLKNIVYMEECIKKLKVIGNISVQNTKLNIDLLPQVFGTGEANVTNIMKDWWQRYLAAAQKHSKGPAITTMYNGLELKGKAISINSKITNNPTGPQTPQIPIIINAKLLGQYIQYALIGSISLMAPGSARFTANIFKNVVKVFANELLASGLIHGLKVRSSGRFNGSTMASAVSVSVGNVPLQSYNTHIDYNEMYFNTKYGTQSLKIWVHK